MSSYLDKMVTYSNLVLAGEVVSCQKHKWACERFLSDLERSESNDPDFPYEFIEAKAEMFEKWAGLFKHTKGVLTGQKIELAPITHFIFGNIYGWYHKDTGLRRFSKMYWQVARKNAKSQMLSLVGSFELFVFCGQEQGEVYTAATKKEQAKIIYEETVTMLMRCDALEEGEHFSVSYGKIKRLSTGGIMRALSKEDKKTGDGYNPSCGLIDEYHAHPTDEIYNIIDSGMGARSQPLLAIITTAGFELSNPCYRVEYDLISKILNPQNPVNLEFYFVMVNELECNYSDEVVVVDGRRVAPGSPIDDINDEKCWEKANPIVCSYPEGIKGIRTRLEVANESPEKMRDFMTKTMNVWVNQRAMGYMDLGRWGSCGTSENIKDLIDENTDRCCYVGVDLSARLDLTSVSFEFFGKDDKYYVVSHSFIPEEMFHEKIKTDKVPYDIWEKQGYITVTEGGVVDYRHVKSYIQETAQRNGWYIEEVCVDPWGATQITSDFEDEGTTVVEIVQGIRTLSEPTKDFRYMVYSDRIVHENDPVLTWAIGNAVTKLDHNKNVMLNKEKSSQKIDPIASVMNAHVRAMIIGQSGSIYEKRGMREL